MESLCEDGMFPQIDLVFKGKRGDKRERDFDFPQFLPTLWQNNMKEPDEQYGKLTTQLTDSILQALETNVSNKSSSERMRRIIGEQSSDKFAAQSMDLFLKRFQMLWKAIKTETYVFKFQNIQAVEAFEHIQGEYDKQVGKFRTQFHDLANSILNTSCNGLHDHDIWTEFNKLHEKIEILVNDQKQEMRVFIDSVINNMDEEDANFVTDYQTILQQNFEMTASFWVAEEKRSATTHITQTTGKKNEKISKKHEYKREVLSSARKCAKSAKGQGKDENLTISDLYEDWQKDALKEQDEKNQSAEEIRLEITRN